MGKELVSNTEVMRTPTQQTGILVSEVKPFDLDVVKQLITAGDLSGLSEDQKLKYYLATCQELGLDPKTQPFSFIKFQKKEVMYANRSCTDQLARIHGISVSTIEGPELRKFAFGGKEVLIWYCKVRASLPNGRSEENVGSLDFNPGNAGNDMMKVGTKAKRRAILSLLGLSMMDETETETVGPSKKTAFKIPENLKEGEIYGSERSNSSFDSAGFDSTSEIISDSDSVKVTVTNFSGKLKDMDEQTQSKAVSMWLGKIEKCSDRESLDKVTEEILVAAKGLDKNSSALAYLRKAVAESKIKFAGG